MGSRLGLGVFCALAMAASVLAATSACSDDDPAPAGSDAGGNALDAGPRRDGPGDDTPEAGSCVAACDEAHPTAVAKDRAIVACWEASCRVPCIDERAAADAGDGGALSCGATPVVTVNRACDECTTASCCTAWAACFSDPECTALNACYQQCPAQP